MTNEEYEEIIRNGERVDWYGEQVPKDLITPLVKLWSENVVAELHILEGELSEVKGKDREKKEHYYNSLWNNVKNAPYKLNKDVYMIKKKRIEAEMKAEEEKKVKKTPRKKTTKSRTKPSSDKSTKNSNLIFGNKK